MANPHLLGFCIERHTFTIPCAGGVRDNSCCRDGHLQAVPGADLHGAVAVVGADGVHVGGRLSDTEAALYQEWIANDRRLRALLTQMRKIAAQATQLIMDEAKNRKVKV